MSVGRLPVNRHLLDKLNVGVLSVKMFVKVVDFVFVQSCKGVVNVA